ncbi:hypothetical protein NC652_030616 [Populus alba x Populus x berolinensis]|nr:hypothetical protein NC652_030616 [Populus alba x Populus x berolinensis]
MHALFIKAEQSPSNNQECNTYCTLFPIHVRDDKYKESTFVASSLASRPFACLPPATSSLPLPPPHPTPSGFQSEQVKT